MSTAQGRRLQELRRSNAATKHAHKNTKRERDRSSKKRKEIQRNHEENRETN